ncbi:hypothetical protein FNO01nite_25680 [Flavobacterium noncentrifugens]|uniref:Uncharacterized protein n=1 Tax=Flavobacterium noncentrifugens TaxID=1128970 RepID=A0A1G8ZNA6_9FLAO|nr:hypothetical protein [Flavobacterium noncentrifugens]GEP51896.1 hypothetical protein FNO01nite_25680 [Flavobacterium noncentrifugens]SDK16586.1 hypothetical protein SAMN04487935_2674 [Flavobacterium noncentrifugens]
MKTIVKTMLASILLANLSISCKKESENTTTEVSSEPTEQITDTTAIDTNFNSTTTVRNTNDKPSAGQQSETSKQSTTTASSSQSKVSKDKKASGMSAPDGTDAENHDGDMYTKNDNTKMPSGTPIK